MLHLWNGAHTLYNTSITHGLGGRREGDAPPRAPHPGATRRGRYMQQAWVWAWRHEGLVECPVPGRAWVCPPVPGWRVSVPGGSLLQQLILAWPALAYPAPCLSSLTLCTPVYAHDTRPCHPHPCLGCPCHTVPGPATNW